MNELTLVERIKTLLDKEKMLVTSLSNSSLNILLQTRGYWIKDLHISENTFDVVVCRLRRLQHHLSYMAEARASIHAFPEFFLNQYSEQYSHQAIGCFPKITLID